MIEIAEEDEKPPKAFLVGEPENDLSELKGLVETLGFEPVHALTLPRLEVQPAYGMGSGKANEITQNAKELQADCIIFDFNLDPRKQRNWEKLAKIPCFDRQEVIIRIFASRAKTREAVLQVELARLTYSLPRLAHSYGDMARQRGGSYGSKGSGETQLELDRRRILERISRLKKELNLVEKNRQTQRKKRTEKPVPSCALVGYTNAGKSSLLQALTGTQTLVEDKLFATLDPLTKKLTLKDGSCILITDTVGFISNLPHSLIDAFKSTLQEAALADVQIIVIDASDPNAAAQYQTVKEVLSEIQKTDEEKQRIIVLNKWDAVLQNDAIYATNVQNEFPKAILVSAHTGLGLEELKHELCELLLGSVQEYEIPASKAELLRLVHNTGTIQEELWLDEAVRIKASVTGRTKSLLEPYRISKNKKEQTE